MEQMYTGIDLGSDSIKIVVASKVNNKFQVLASSSSISEGIKKGKIVDTAKAVDSLNKVKQEIEEMINMRLRKAVIAIKEDNVEALAVEGKAEVIDPDEITGDDITNCIKDSLLGKIESDKELITAVPIRFTVNGQSVKDPKNMSADLLEAKIAISIMDKKELYKILEVIRLAKIETVDIVLGTIADYYEAKTIDYDKSVTAIVNIGVDTTIVSVFNKGILVKSSTLAIGSKFIDKDINYVEKISLKASKQIKEDFAMAKEEYADPNDYYELMLEDNNIKEIKQIEISEIVGSRVTEILKLIKNELNLLTKGKISYIIVTGGLTELSGFSYVVDDILGETAKVLNMSTMGVRHNKYSTALGCIKYYDEKLRLRGQKMQMFKEEDINNMLGDIKQEVVSENMINKMFGHFFEN